MCPQSARFLASVLLAGVCLLHGGFAWAQGSAADPAAVSSSLTNEQRAQARQLFATGFELWQGGDCAAAVLAFGQGLVIDPANPQANFYRGDCLQKLRRREEAAEAFKRAMTYGAGTPEGFKAQAALNALAKPASVQELSENDIKTLLVGNWRGYGDCGNDNFEIDWFTVTAVEGDFIRGIRDFNWRIGFREATLNGRQIEVRFAMGATFRGQLVGVRRIEGMADFPSTRTRCRWYVTKQGAS